MSAKYGLMRLSDSIEFRHFFSFLYCVGLNSKGLIPRALYLGEMRKNCARNEQQMNDKLGFARKKFVSPVSRIQLYSPRKRKKWRNSIESLKCSHPYFANTISREEFRRRGITPS